MADDGGGGGGGGGPGSGNKAHHARRAGAKADKRAEHAARKLRAEGKAPAPQQRAHNNRAFGVAKFGRANRAVQRNLDLRHRKVRAPVVDRAPAAAPPVVVVVMGPAGSGKTTLIRALVRRYSRHSLAEVSGPVTVVTGSARRVTFFECPSGNLPAMIDLAKIADLVLLTVDGSFGFEMETFEFLNVLQVHGFPRVMGVLTHLDGFRDGKRLRRVKKTLKQRFWLEIHEGAKLFYLSGLANGSYLHNEVHNLSLYISRIKFRPLSWRAAHPYLLADRVEDLTEPALVAADPGADRRVALFGFLRGAHLNPAGPGGARVHVAGAGDFVLRSVQRLDDPVPLPETDPEKRKARRTLNAKETLLYAPMSNVGAVLYDKDAVYISLPQGAHFTRPELLLDGAHKDGDGEVMPPQPHQQRAGGGAGAASSSSSSSSSSAMVGGGVDDDAASDVSDAEAAALRGGGRRGARGELRTADCLSLVRRLQGARHSADARLGAVGMQLFPGGGVIRDRDAREVMGDADGGEDEDEEEGEGDEDEDENEEGEYGDEDEDEVDEDEDGDLDEDEDGEDLLEDDEDEDEDLDGAPAPRRGGRAMPRRRTRRIRPRAAARCLWR